MFFLVLFVVMFIVGAFGLKNVLKFFISPTMGLILLTIGFTAFTLFLISLRYNA